MEILEEAIKVITESHLWMYPPPWIVESRPTEYVVVAYERTQNKPSKIKCDLFVSKRKEVVDAIVKVANQVD